MILGTTIVTIAVEILAIATVGATTTATILMDSKAMLTQLSPIQLLRQYQRATTVYNPRHHQLQQLSIRRHLLTEWASFITGAHVTDSTDQISFNLTVDSRSNGDFVDSELLPDIERQMVEYVQLDPPMTILTAGR